MSRRKAPGPWWIVFGLQALPVANPGIAQTVPPGATSSPGETLAPLEEVVVTAQKRTQRLQDVPISETVIGADELRSLQILCPARHSGVSAQSGGGLQPI